MPVRIQSRTKGIRPRDAPLPKGLDGRNVVAILTGSNYQVASRIWLDAGREPSVSLSTRGPASLWYERRYFPRR